MKSLFSTAYRLAGNAHDAEDIVQETFLRAYRGFHLYTPGTNIRAWLFTILRRVHTDAVRRSMRSVLCVELPDEQLLPAAAGRASSHDDAGDVRQALGRLPEPFRSALVLRDVEGLSYDEIAAALDIPPGTVMSRIYRGRARLRAELSPA